jgi:hypothetical protein
MPLADQRGLWGNLYIMLEAARALTEPSEVNAEYVRGQVNLITDTSGLGLGEEHYGVLTNIITHRVTIGRGMAAIADDLRDRETVN